ncbi:MAG: alpha/beta hydrolase [Stellaceae bacterium]
MALDHDAERVLEMVRLSGRPPYETLSAPEARELFLAAREVLAPDPAPIAEIRELAAPRPAGGAIPLRLYRGAATACGEILPALVYFHGGGWVIGDLDTHDSLCRHLANAAQCIVVAVDYRLAPEHKFPAAVEDCFTATSWVAQEGAALGADRERLAVGGDSAGGNLAAVVSLIARDRSAPKLRCQVLLYPAVDCAMTHVSHERFAEGYLLTRPTMKWFYGHYLREPADVDDWRASPLRAADLSGVAPALVLTAGNDVLCDEGEAYARRLQQASVPVQLRHFPDQIHGFLTMGKIVQAARPALDDVAAALRAAWDAR